MQPSIVLLALGNECNYPQTKISFPAPLQKSFPGSIQIQIQCFIHNS